MNSKEWIYFRRLAKDQDRKTDRWEVLTKDNDTFLGMIKWYGAWRKYVFVPDTATIYEQDCLRVIANFIETETEEYRQNRLTSLLNKL